VQPLFFLWVLVTFWASSANFLRLCKGCTRSLFLSLPFSLSSLSVTFSPFSAFFLGFETQSFAGFSRCRSSVFPDCPCTHFCVGVALFRRPFCCFAFERPPTSHAPRTARPPNRPNNISDVRLCECFSKCWKAVETAVKAAWPKWWGEGRGGWQMKSPWKAVHTE